MAEAALLELPAVPPQGYPPLEREPAFDPARHLQLERPDRITTLAELGYGANEIAACPSDFGITSCFRILSDEGAAALLEVCRALAPYATSSGRIPRKVRGAVFQSKFLRDLCLSREVTDFLGEVAGLKLLPHSIPHHLGHINLNPLEVGQNVDKWHVDTLRVDYVLFVTDPATIRGGEFQFFKGTKHEIAELHRDGKAPPPERVVTPRIPGPGYAVLQQGNMVVHRAAALKSAGERITMVNGYVPRDAEFPDYNRFDQIYHADPAHVAASEYARHVAWTGRERLQAFIDQGIYTEDRAALADRLEKVADYLARAGADIRNAGAGKLEHFGDG
ncbi:hypothetical protein A8950_2118 [Dongia mobilis]|uniref:Fe2OG dioxygenase domain-containing protein n=1 Tax=Dongia mobilis TaxID=578943 RepID=A0A4R6WR56_9PROT|nr:hypothetical protein [Dongia mobilis]TDQ82296.1 hypothetical protein A8950_2118 [Dongia mobilis]